MAGASRRLPRYFDKTVQFDFIVPDEAVDEISYLMEMFLYQESVPAVVRAGESQVAPAMVGGVAVNFTKVPMRVDVFSAMSDDYVSLKLDECYGMAVKEFHRTNMLLSRRSDIRYATGITYV